MTVTEYIEALIAEGASLTRAVVSLNGQSPDMPSSYTASDGQVVTLERGTETDLTSFFRGAVLMARCNGLVSLT